jgi:hypothetical protein
MRSRQACVLAVRREHDAAAATSSTTG